MLKQCNDPFQHQALWVLGKKAHKAVEMKALRHVKTLLALQLPFNCVLLALVTRIAAANILVSIKYLHCYRNCFYIMYNEHKLYFLSLSFQSLLCLVFHFEDFPSLSSYLRDAVLLWRCWSVLCSTQPPLAQWQDFQRLPSQFTSIACFPKTS